LTRTKPWTMTKSDLRKGRKSVYYKKWSQALENLPAIGGINRRTSYDCLLAMHDADDANFRYGTTRKSAASLRALKAAIIDGTVPSNYGSGCIINRYVNAPTW